MNDADFLSEISGIVQTSGLVQPRGAGTKSAMLQRDPDCRAIDMTPYSGIIEYDPGEFTFTVRSGTPLSEIRSALAEHRQYMPFDPLLIDSGATIGGTVAAGMNGSCRVLYGGIRDFILGVQFIDGHGNVHRGGGKVVKNAAGFDLPKFFVGSMGRFGILTEFCFKVFPEPSLYRSLVYQFAEVHVACEAIQQLSGSGLQMVAVDLESNVNQAAGEDECTLAIRICGDRPAMDKQAARVSELISEHPQLLDDEVDQQYWSDVREFRSPNGYDQDAVVIVKVPITPKQIPALENSLGEVRTKRYSVFGNVAWLFADSNQIERIDSVLSEHDLSGLVVIGRAPHILPGAAIDNGFSRRMKTALDPETKFGPFGRNKSTLSE